MTHVADARVAGRPPRDTSLDNVIRNMEMWTTMMDMVGMPHPAMDENPRPMNELSLYDLKANGNSALGGEQSLAPPNAYYYCFYADRFRSDPRQAVSVPRKHLWWLAAPTDQVLLSDRTTHHVTSILRVDRDHERVYFSDPWPDLFPLLPGKNTLGIEAQRSGGLSVSRAEFVKAAVGLVTLDTSTLAESYLSTFPDMNTAATNLRFGLNVIDAGRESALMPQALEYFGRAEKLAVQAQDEALGRRSTAHVWMALVCMRYAAAARGDTVRGQAIQARLDMLLSFCHEDQLRPELSGDDFGRMGNAAGQGRDFPAAIHYFDLGLAAEPELERVWMLRGSAKLALQDHHGAIEDASRALELNARRRGEVTARRNARDPRDGFGRGLDDTEINRLNGLKMQALGVRLKAAIAVGRHDLVQQDGPELEAYAQALAARSTPTQ